MEKKCVYCGAPLPGDAAFCHCCARSQQEKRLFFPPRRRRRIRWPLWAAAAAALLAIACVPILRGQAAPSDLLPAGQPTALPEAAASTAPQTVPIPETTVPEETLTQLQELALNAIEEALATPDLETHTPQLTNAIEYRSGNWDGKRSTFHGLLLRLEGNFLLEDEYDSHLNVLLDMDTGEILNSTQLDYDRIRAYQRTVANREQYHHLLLNAYRSFLEDDLLQIWMDSEIRDELPQEDLDAVNSRLALDFPEEEAEMGFGFPGEIPLPVQSCSFEEGALAELEALPYDYSEDALAAVADALKIQDSGPVRMQSNHLENVQDARFYIVNGEKRGQWALHTNGDQEYVLYHDFENGVWARHLWVYANGVMMDDYWYADGTRAARFALTEDGQYTEMLYYPGGKQSYRFLRDAGVEQAEIHAPEGIARLTLNASGAGTELSAYAANGSRSRHIWFFPDGSTQTE